MGRADTDDLAEGGPQLLVGLPHEVSAREREGAGEQGAPGRIERSGGCGVRVVLKVPAEQQLLHERIAVYRLDGALFFGAAQRFLDELAAVGDVEVVILRLSGIRVLDATGANALAEMVRDLEQRGITVLLKGVNDTLAEARDLVRLMKGVPSKINLIPFNPWPGSPYECSDWETIEAFAEVLNRAGFASPIRTPRGRDILAACGQLRSESVKVRASELRKQQLAAEGSEGQA